MTAPLSFCAACPFCGEAVFGDDETCGSDECIDELHADLKAERQGEDDREWAREQGGRF